MTLKDWLAGKELSHSDFAKQIDRTTEAVRRYVAGERIPDRESMLKIVEVTNGEVTANDFFGIVPSAEAA